MCEGGVVWGQMMGKNCCFEVAWFLVKRLFCIVCCFCCESLFVWGAKKAGGGGYELVGLGGG